MQDSIFSKIVKGDIPASKIYEDELTMAFMSIMPVVPGHVLVITKKQVEYLWDLDDENYQAVMATAKKVALQMRKVLGAERIGVKVIGEEVPHVHIHLIPFNNMDEYNAEPKLAAPNELEEMAKKLAL